MVRNGRALFVVHDIYQSDNRLPMGPAYLASALKSAGHEVSVYSQDVFHYPNEHLAEFLSQNEFDMIGLGFLAARYVETIRPLAKVINKHKKKAKFVIGGHCTSAIPQYMLEDLSADVAIVGEGEGAIVDLMGAIVSGGSVSCLKLLLSPL